MYAHSSNDGHVRLSGCEDKLSFHIGNEKAIEDIVAWPLRDPGGQTNIVIEENMAKHGLQFHLTDRQFANTVFLK